MSDPLSKDTRFDLDKNALADILLKKGITHLYHANTVATSCTFITQGHLLSRKYVEDQNLFQTEQYSDEKDKRFAIWDGVFLDMIDIHKVFKRPNKYGPVLFCFDVNLLRSDLVETIRITKKNPVHWKDTEFPKDWYYEDLNHFETNYQKGNPREDIGSMLIIKNKQERLPLLPYLSKIVVDNPFLVVNYKGQKKKLSSIVTSDFDALLSKYGLTHIQKELRHKKRVFGCKCSFRYNYLLVKGFKELKRLFHNSPTK